MSASVAESSGPQLSPEAEAFVNAVGAAASLPAFVRNVRAISTVASNLDARVAQLESAIMQDVALSAKVLRIAKSVTGSSGEGVDSVKQAIMLLGYDRVQHLSTAASVFEKLEQDAPSTRDLLVESILSANHSLQLAMSAGYEAPELAYLCGLFRRLGEVLVACYRTRPYRTWLDKLQAGAPGTDGAQTKHFGFTFDEVGIALARKWGIPPAVVRTMRPCNELTSDGDVLHMITQSSADIARDQYGAVPSTRDVTELRERMALALGIEAKDVEGAMAVALKESKPTLNTMSVDLDRWLAGHADAMAVVKQKQAVRAAKHEQRLQARRGAGETISEDELLFPVYDDAHEAREQEAAETQAMLERLAPSDHDSAHEKKLRDTVRLLVEQKQRDASRLDVGSVTQSALGAACEAGYERGVLGISSEDFKMIRGKLGIGRGGHELSRTFLLRPTASFGPLGAALQQRQDLFVMLSGAELKTYGKDRLLRDLTPAHFALLPLVLEDKLIGCLYFDGAEPVETTETARQLIRDMRDQLVGAFARRRASESATAGTASNAA
ncbi:MAG: HDOD domain-containing protein [Gemmatimonadetes bacterium]|nr:HDOD domain-containing protein [Gemmatimonadota bacterium]